MERLERSIREAPVVDRDGYDYLVHPISNCVPALAPALLREVVVGVVQHVDLTDVDKLVAPEAMGIHLSTAVSLFTDVPLVVVRKREYGLPGEVAVRQETGYSEDTMYVNDVDPDDRVVIIDDLISTGGTLAGIVDALDDIGATIADIVVVIRKVGGPDALERVEHPITTLVDVEVSDGRARVLES